jgi:hypothetical protein
MNIDQFEDVLSAYADAKGLLDDFVAENAEVIENYESLQESVKQLGESVRRLAKNLPAREVVRRLKSKGFSKVRTVTRTTYNIDPKLLLEKYGDKILPRADSVFSIRYTPLKQLVVLGVLPEEVNDLLSTSKTETTVIQNL